MRKNLRNITASILTSFLFGLTAWGQVLLTNVDEPKETGIYNTVSTAAIIPGLTFAVTKLTDKGDGACDADRSDKGTASGDKRRLRRGQPRY